MQLAPIGLSTYSRVAHLTRTINALRENQHAAQSHLYVFSDAPRPGDEARVAAVRSHLRTIDGFKDISIIERQTNSRTFNNRSGLKSLLDQYGKAVFLEEDIVTAPGFLDFINRGLDTYRERRDIFAICGYTPPANLSACYRRDAYLSPRFSAWGFGTWKDRYDRLSMSIEDYPEFLKDRKSVNRFRKGGEDLLPMLHREATGKIDALDVKIFYYQFRHGMYTVAPTVSLTLNVGHDGTGVHCGTTDRFDVTLPDRAAKLHLDPNLKLVRRVVGRLYRFRSRYPIETGPYLLFQLRAAKSATVNKMRTQLAPIMANARAAGKHLVAAARKSLPLSRDRRGR